MKLDNVVWLHFGSLSPLRTYAPRLLCHIVSVNMSRKTIGILPPLPKDCGQSRTELQLDDVKLSEDGEGLLHYLHFQEDFRGATLKVGVFSVKPYLDIDSEEKCSYPTGGVFLETLKTMAQHLNFRYELVCTKGRFGSWNAETDTWTGLMGLLQQKQVHFIMPLLPTRERAENIEFSYPVIFDDIVFLTRKPDEKSRTFALAKPYTPQMWACIGSSIVVTSFIMSWMSRTMGRIRRPALAGEESSHRSQFPPEDPQLNMVTSAWYLFATLTNQGGATKLPTSGQMRLVLTAWWLYALVIVTGYSGTLISFLNSPGLEPAVDDLNELEYAIENKGYVAGSGAGTSVQQYLQSKKVDSMYYKIGKVAREEPNRSVVPNFNAGVQRVLREKDYVLLSTSGTSYAAAIPHGLDNFHFGSEKLAVASTSIGMPKRSPLKENFDDTLLKIHESGMMQQWINSYFDKFRAKSEGQLMSESEKRERALQARRSKPLSAKEMLGPYLVWATGQLVSAMAFILEILWKRSKAESSSTVQTSNSRRRRRHMGIGVSH